MAADKPVINPFRAPGISVIGLPAAHTRDIIIGSLARICCPVPLFPLFPRFLPPVSPAATPPSSFLPLPLLLSASVVRASALIMRGFRRSRFHSFLRLRHREMIIGTWPMWSVHTRNETTSRMVSSRGARRETCRGGGPRGRMESTARGGKMVARGTPARRLALYGSHVGVGDVGALRLVQCALYSPTLRESHALTSSSGAEDPRRRERRREESVSRGDLRVSERRDFSYKFV